MENISPQTPQQNQPMTKSSLGIIGFGIAIFYIVNLIILSILPPSVKYIRIIDIVLSLAGAVCPFALTAGTVFGVIGLCKKPRARFALAALILNPLLFILVGFGVP